MSDMEIHIGFSNEKYTVLNPFGIIWYSAFNDLNIMTPFESYAMISLLDKSTAWIGIVNIKWFTT